MPESIGVPYERDLLLDNLDAWMEHFAEQPGASQMPEWLEALRSLREQRRPDRSYDAAIGHAFDVLARARSSAGDSRALCEIAHAYAHIAVTIAKQM